MTAATRLNPVFRPFATQTPLWKHVDLIRAMCRGHRTWPEIARCLEQEHGLKTSHKTVHGFFKRVVSRDKLPLGWAEPEQPSQATPAPDVDAKKETVPDQAPTLPKKKNHWSQF